MSPPKVVFKGGTMDGAEITYQKGFYPEHDEEIIVKSNHLDTWGCLPSDEVYRYFSILRSWVYDHEMEVVAEDD